jgi:hypothetical protein
MGIETKLNRIYFIIGVSPSVNEKSRFPIIAMKGKRLKDTGLPFSFAGMTQIRFQGVISVPR